ncbi:ABC transporter ATP-binding protein [Methylobacterium sp. Leaf466]|uniref:ABC transporter ATP-binding protein n=1 Tax=Methylobacterium sp. Leaf466 TaxID=1736386 RepID=UPI0009EA4134|nr:ABC transporter ATP-binding protein [Methylobacterium sp. Leaf466]
MPTPPLLRIAGLTKRFGAFTAVDDVSLDLAPGEFVCLLGPSGCGKSTLLRLVAGFEAPTSGTIHLGADDLAALPAHRRPVNMMFQSYALFPHLSVGRNVGYGLKGLGLGRGAVAERIATLLRLVRLEGFEARLPETLSGGQRQRVALARALAREPRVLLLDEPLGALDRALREETQGELRALQRRLGTSFVVVTHDAGEAMTMADRIGVMRGGRLVQIGTPADLYERPADRFVAALLGDVNLVDGRIAGRGDGAHRVEAGFGPVDVAASDRAWAEGEAVVVALRPERIDLSRIDLSRIDLSRIDLSRIDLSQADPATRLSGTVADRTYLGDRIRYGVRLSDGTLIRVMRPAASAFVPGDTVAVDIDPRAAAILPP